MLAGAVWLWLNSMVTSRPALALNPLSMTMAWDKPGPIATERTIRNGMKPSVNRAANCSELSMNPSSHSWVQTRPATVGSSRFRPALNAVLAIRQTPARRGPRSDPGPGDADPGPLLLPSACMVTGRQAGTAGNMTSALVAGGSSRRLRVGLRWHIRVRRRESRSRLGSRPVAPFDGLALFGVRPVAIGGEWRRPARE